MDLTKNVFANYLMDTTKIILNLIYYRLITYKFLFF
jgi:hypothetical protein